MLKRGGFMCPSEASGSSLARQKESRFSSLRNVFALYQSFCKLDNKSSSKVHSNERLTKQLRSLSSAAASDPPFPYCGCFILILEIINRIFLI